MKKLFIILSCLLVLTSCSAIRKGALDTFQEYPKNVETVRQIAQILHETWPMRWGWLKVLYEYYEFNLPGFIKHDIDRLNELTSTPFDRLTDEEKGEIVARRARLVSEQAKQIYGALKMPVKTIMGILF